MVYINKKNELIGRKLGLWAQFGNVVELIDISKSCVFRKFCLVIIGWNHYGWISFASELFHYTYIYIFEEFWACQNFRNAPISRLVTL